MMKPSNPRHGELIVNFPSSRSSTAAKTVRFSSVAQVRYIQYPSEEDIDKLWYTKEDREHFKTNMMRDAIKCSKMLDVHFKQSGQSKQYSEVLSCHCVGLEHLISNDVSKRCKAVQTARKEHVRKVMDEVDRQRSCGHSSPANLARVSSESSRIARRRSHTIAMLVSLAN